jgi:pilus assembly protein CpaE
LGNETEFDGALLWVCRDTASRELVTEAAREFRLSADYCAPEEALERLRGRRYDLIGVELDVDPRPSVALLRELHGRAPRVTLLAASADTSVAVMRSALEAGANDVLSLPLSRHELHKALIKFTQVRAREGAARAVGDVITVCGARGGLGVTTLAVNLAVQLTAVTGSEVGLVDLDLQRGDVSAFLNLTPIQSIAAIAGARGEVDDIFLHGTLSRHPSGVFVLPAPQQMEEADAVGPEDVELALRLMRTQFRYTVVDTPRTITGATLAALEHADRILLLTDLSVPGVRSAQRIVELLRRLGTPPDRIDLLVTRAVPGPVEIKEAARAVGKEPFLVIPRDEEAAGKAMNTGVPLNGQRPEGLTIAVAALATRLSGIRPQAKARGAGLFRRIFSKEAWT